MPGSHHRVKHTLCKKQLKLIKQYRADSLWFDISHPDGVRQLTSQKKDKIVRDVNALFAKNGLQEHYCLQKLSDSISNMMYRWKKQNVGKKPKQDPSHTKQQESAKVQQQGEGNKRQKTSAYDTILWEVSDNDDPNTELNFSHGLPFDITELPAFERKASECDHPISEDWFLY